ncbi:alpha-amylase family glycosyl hydrolase [Microbacter margulisiae]|uniref:Glycosidase n=1 Tax=Microbacter margulisiae TaxID=1350067 RepID=A0A7W5DQU4_9PORP|nr:alpha-amylase family glycosyl hydrolase [Microbacter margulisiae]MBB3187405.1 glycosidase [Microbacter margulisiae]
MRSVLRFLLLSTILLLFGCSKSHYAPDSGGLNHTPFTNTPSIDNMVVYELNIPVFSSEGTLYGAMQRLDSLKNSDINVIWLMPIYPIGILKSIGSPYCVRNYTEVNTTYGTLDNLRAFVNSAHSKNMAVILDWVADHTSWDNPWIQNKSWYKQDANGKIISPAGTNWTDVAQLNYANTNMRMAMIQAMKYWITQANIDGFRCDAADMIPSDFWQQAIDTLNSIAGRKLIFLAEGTNSSDFADGFQVNYAWDFSNKIKSIFKGENAGDIFTTDSAEYSLVPSGDQKLRFIINHDEDNSDSLAGYYHSPAGSLAAFVATAFMRGVPLIYNGQEVAYPHKIPFYVNGALQPITWNINPAIYNAYKKIMQIRSTLPAVKDGRIMPFYNTNVIAFKRIDASEEIAIIVNVRNVSEDYALPVGLTNSVWINAENSSKVSLSTHVTLSPYSYLILKQ